MLRINFMKLTTILKFYSRASIKGHLSATASFFALADRKSIHWLLFKPLYNGQLSTTAAGTKVRPQHNNLSTTDSFFQLTDKMSRMATKFEPYGSS